MSASPAKFTFDLDLKRSPEKDRVISESRLDAMLREAREAGLAEGLVQGEQTVAARAARTLALAAESLAARATEMNAALDDARASLLRDGAELAASIGRKLAGHLLAERPEAEIAALIAECMASLDGVPHLVIRCHPELADAVRTIATSHMTSSGFTGRLVVMGDPDQAMGDCRLEWVDGGLVRNFDDISAEIDARIAAYLAARGADGAKENTQ